MVAEVSSAYRGRKGIPMVLETFSPTSSEAAREGEQPELEAKPTNLHTLRVWESLGQNSGGKGKAFHTAE